MFSRSFVKQKYIIAAALFFTVLSATTLDAAVKKKVFIGAIKARNVSENLAHILQNSIGSSILENYGSSYYVIDSNDIKIALSKEEFRQVMGCSDESCISMIGESLRTDENIYGTISKNGGSLVILLTNSLSSTLTKKSIVTIRCKENQLEWYGKEAAKKLINPRYRVRKPGIGDIEIAPVAIHLEKLSVERVKGVDISVMKFSSPDRAVSVIIGSLKPDVRKGDSYFKDGDYSDAESTYQSVLIFLLSELTSKKRNKPEVINFEKKIKKRLFNAMYMKAVDQLDEVDKSVHNEKIEDTEELNAIIKQYDKISEEVIKKRNNNPDMPFAQLLTTINNRVDNIFLSYIAFKEKEAASLYNNKEFSNAVDLYKDTVNQALQIRNEREKQKTLARLNRKIEITQATGTGLLASRVNYLLDTALVEKAVRKNLPKAKSIMAQGKEYINNNRKFLTSELFDDYNETADLIGTEPLKSNKAIEQRAIKKAKIIKQEKINNTRRKKIYIDFTGNIMFFDSSNTSTYGGDAARNIITFGPRLGVAFSYFFIDAHLLYNDSDLNLGFYDEDGQSYQQLEMFQLGGRACLNLPSIKSNYYIALFGGFGYEYGKCHFHSNSSASPEKDYNSSQLYFTVGFNFLYGIKSGLKISMEYRRSLVSKWNTWNGVAFSVGYAFNFGS
ncbi:MAG: hypothetical protein GY754_34220 [bacterium]|nr:hypothetical protein [bacterium]